MDWRRSGEYLKGIFESNPRKEEMEVFNLQLNSRGRVDAQAYPRYVDLLLHRTVVLILRPKAGNPFLRFNVVIVPADLGVV